MAPGSDGDGEPDRRVESEEARVSPFAPPSTPSGSDASAGSAVPIGPATGPSLSPLIDPIANSVFAPPKGTPIEVGAVPIGPPTAPTSSTLINAPVAGVAWTPPTSRPTVAPPSLPWSPPIADGPGAGTPAATDDLPAPLDWFPIDDDDDTTPSTVVVRTRPNWRKVGAVVVTLSLLAASTLLLASAVLTDGAATPEDAVVRLFDAIDHEDLIGILEVLSPSERDAIKAPVTELMGELQRLGLLQAFELASVPGSDLRVEDLALRTEPAGENPDVTAVTVTRGRVDGRADPAALPFGETLRRILSVGRTEPLAISSEPFAVDLGMAKLRLITVREKRGWHVSLISTVADALRGDRSAAPSFGGGPDPVGSSSPDGAVRELAAAAAALDPARALTVLAPDELRGVYDASPLFLPILNREITSRRAEDFRIELGTFDTRVEGGGAVRRVFVTAVDLRFDDRRSGYHLTYDGTCLRLDEWHRRGRGRRDTQQSVQCLRTRSGPNTGTVPLAPAAGATATTPGDGADGGGTLDRFGVLAGLSADSAVVVVERDGRWYVSPTRTLFESLLVSLRRTGREDIERWGNEWVDLFDGSAGNTPSRPAGVAPVSGPFGSTGWDSRDPEWGPRSRLAFDCSSTTPPAMPPGASGDRVAFLSEEAVRLCFNERGDEYPSPNGCYASYLVLSMRTGVDDDQWQEADRLVGACLRSQVDQNAGGARKADAPTG